MAPVAPYANDHQDPNGEGDARPTALKIIRDQGLDGKLVGKVFLITGCSAGIGVETARAIHATGADVYITGRNKEKGQQVANKIAKDGKPGSVVFLEMDLESVAKVKETAAEFRKLSSKLNVLICNAGVGLHPKSTTKDGFEMHFGVNHVGHFALFESLKEMLLDSSTPDCCSRVVMVSSMAHQMGALDLNDYNFEQGYDPIFGYARSKSANIWMANEIDRRYGTQGLHATSVHPGVIITNLERHNSDDRYKLPLDKPHFAALVKSVPQGAATTVWAAVGKEWEGRGGRYLAECREELPMTMSVQEAMQSGTLADGYAQHCYNAEAEKALWDLSAKLLEETTN